MRVLTLREPWATAIMQLGKNVENRPWAPANGWRGIVVIHAGKTFDESAPFDTVLDHAVGDALALDAHLRYESMAVLGTVELYAVHRDGSTGCACPEDGWAQHSGDPVKPMFHWMLRNPRRLVTPIRRPGRLSLWEPDDSLTHLLGSQEYMS
jgi:hypothetical protein